MEYKITITIELANAILNYLGTKPYVEVAPLINELQNQANNSANNSSEVIES